MASEGLASSALFLYHYLCLVFLFTLWRNTNTLIHHAYARGLLLWVPLSACLKASWI